MIVFETDKYIKDTIDTKGNIDNIDIKGKDENSVVIYLLKVF